MPASCVCFHISTQTHQESPGFSPGNPHCGCGVIKVIANRRLVLRKRIVDGDAHLVFAHIFGAGVALAVAVEASERIGAAGLRNAA